MAMNIYIKVEFEPTNSSTENQHPNHSVIIRLKYLQKEWPKVTKNVSSDSKLYFKSLGDLHTNEGLLFINNMIFIPKTLRH